MKLFAIWNYSLAKIIPILTLKKQRRNLIGQRKSFLLVNIALFVSQGYLGSMNKIIPCIQMFINYKCDWGLGCLPWNDTWCFRVFQKNNSIELQDSSRNCWVFSQNFRRPGLVVYSRSWCHGKFSLSERKPQVPLREWSAIIAMTSFRQVARHW
jgi:hypothetical protein